MKTIFRDCVIGAGTGLAVSSACWAFPPYGLTAVVVLLSIICSYLIVKESLKGNDNK